MNKYLVVGIGGFIGAIARFGGYISNRMGTRFPYGTLVINCTGSFLIGFVLTLLAEKTHWSPNWRYLIPIGFIGAYTTLVSVIDSEDKVEKLLPYLDQMVDQGLIAMSEVEVVKFIHQGGARA